MEHSAVDILGEQMNCVFGKGAVYIVYKQPSNEAYPQVKCPGFEPPQSFDSTSLVSRTESSAG
jgi:hypothetical protein